MRSVVAAGTVTPRRQASFACDCLGAPRRCKRPRKSPKGVRIGRRSLAPRLAPEPEPCITSREREVRRIAAALAAVHGDASSSVVVDCSPGGSMYRYFAGDAVTEASMVFRWMVVYNGAQTR